MPPQSQAAKPHIKTAHNLADLQQVQEPNCITAGSHLGNWLLQRPLSQGSFGRTFLASPRVAGHDRQARYVVKVLDEPWCHNAAAVEQFRREAQVGSQVGGPHLIPVLAAQLQQKPYYLVMPLAEGLPLTAWAALKANQHWTTRLWILRQTAQALLRLHSGGWTHGDVKPENLIVGPSGHVTLIDLGFAQPLGARPTGQTHVSGLTPVYAAPEVLSAEPTADARADLFSLGVVAYELFSGRRPFEGATPSDLALAHRQSYPMPLRRRVSELPPAVCRVVHRLLAKSPWLRPQTGAEVVREFTRLEIAHFRIWSQLAYER